MRVATSAVPRFPPPPPMNVHHLELFYYVARHGGITAAVRHIPYGIQQPAVSGQMRQLEVDLDVKLFERSPFRLTAKGVELFAHVEPFFEGLDGLASRLRDGAEQEMRLGGAELVLRDHLSVVMQRVRAAHPGMRLSLHAGDQTQVEEWLRNGEIDLAVTSVGSRAPLRLRQIRFVRIPLVLLVHRNAPTKEVKELWAQKKIAVPLVGQPAKTSFMQGFQNGLKRHGVTWRQTVEVTSAELVMRYVANGEGYGVANLGVPAIIQHRDVRVLPLDGFEPMTMGALWRGELSPLARRIIEEAQRYGRATWPQWSCDDELS